MPTKIFEAKDDQGNEYQIVAFYGELDTSHLQQRGSRISRQPELRTSEGLRVMSTLGKGVYLLENNVVVRTDDPDAP